MFIKYSLNIYAFCMGIAAITVQIILMREFMAVFYGNELCIGILLSVWLFWVAVGSRLGNIFIRIHVFKKLKTFSLLMLLLIIVSVLAVIAIKYVRIQFSFLTGITSSVNSLRGDPASRVYIFEAFGSACAGFLVSLVALRFLSNMDVLLFLAFFLFMVIFIVNKKIWTIFISIFMVLILFSPQSETFQTGLLQKYWHSFDKQMQLIDWRQSKFGELTLVDWGGEKSLYINGLKQTIVPDPIGSQELASLILNQHSEPHDILLLGGGLGGLAAELARYKNSNIVYIELDKEAYDITFSHLDSLQQFFFRKPNLKIKFTDGRYFLSTSKESYDMIIVNVGKPATASNNRYFTQEFFKLAKNKLKPGGIFTICGFPSAENYFGPELLQLNAGLYSQLQHEFNDIVVIPGDAAIYFASLNSPDLTTNPDILTQRFIEKGIQCDYFYPQMFWQYYLPGRLNFIKESLVNTRVKRNNRDFAPVSYYYDFVLWNKLVRGHSGLFTQISLINFEYTLFFLIFILILLVIISLFIRKKKSFHLTCILGLTAYFGFASITLNVLLLLSFQIIFGYIYEWIGLALSVYMAGMAFTSMVVNNNLEKISNKYMLVVFLFLLTMLLLFLTPILHYIQTIRSYFLFFILLFLAGALTGGTFPFVSELYYRIGGRYRAGSVYAADLIGGACGSLIVSGLFIPLYGFTKTLLLTAVVGIIFFFYLLVFTRNIRHTKLKTR